MNDQGIPQNFGQPPQHGGISRFLSMARSAAMGTAWVMVAVLILEVTAPPYLKPSQLMGSFVGNVERAEIQAKQQYAAGYAAAMSTAQAQGPIAIENNRQQQQRLSDSMQTEILGANMADLACLGGVAINAMSGGDPSYQSVGRTLGAACGASQGIRRTMAQEQADISGGPPAVFETRDAYRPVPSAGSVQTSLQPEQGPAVQPAAPVQPAYAALPAPGPPVSAEHRIYQKIHFAEWQAKLGPVRMAQIRRASGDDMYSQDGFNRYVDMVEAAARQTY